MHLPTEPRHTNVLLLDPDLKALAQGVFTNRTSTYKRSSPRSWSESTGPGCIYPQNLDIQTSFYSILLWTQWPRVHLPREPRHTYVPLLDPDLNALAQGAFTHRTSTYTRSSSRSRSEHTGPGCIYPQNLDIQTFFSSILIWTHWPRVHLPTEPRHTDVLLLDPDLNTGCIYPQNLDIQTFFS